MATEEYCNHIWLSQPRGRLHCKLRPWILQSDKTSILRWPFLWRKKQQRNGKKVAKQPNTKKLLNWVLYFSPLEAQAGKNENHFDLVFKSHVMGPRWMMPSYLCKLLLHWPKMCTHHIHHEPHPQIHIQVCRLQQSILCATEFHWNPLPIFGSGNQTMINSPSEGELFHHKQADVWTTP